MPCLLLILPGKYNHSSFRELETGLEKLANLSEVIHFRPVGTLFPQATPTGQWVQLAAEEYVCMSAKSLQPCPTFCDPMDCRTRLLCPWGFSRKEDRSGLPCLPPGDLPNPGMEPTSLTSPALAARFFTTSATCDALKNMYMCGEPGVGSWERLFCPGPLLGTNPLPNWAP